MKLENANTNVSFFYEPIMYEIIPPGTILLMIDTETGTNLFVWIIMLAIILIVLLTIRYLYLLWKRRKNRA